MHIHELAGCSPEPLGFYLKALGVLRLVAEQADPGARGWWRDERFFLATELDAEQLLDFFLLRYEPSPITAPWNKGAGFFIANDPGLAPVEAARGARFQRLRDGIVQARRLIGVVGSADAEVRAIKGEAKARNLSRSARESLRKSEAYRSRLREAEKRFAAAKANLIPNCRKSWRGQQREWMDAAVVLPSRDAKPAFPALLGTGGNDGRLDFTNNFYQRLGDLFDLSSAEGLPRPGARRCLDTALFGGLDRVLQKGKATGQFLPGFAGGANSGNEASGDSAVNAADFVLMLEGALIFTAHVTRRIDAVEQLSMAAPFAVRPAACGYPSAAQSDEGARGEQWFPLWEQPAGLLEVRQLFAEARSRVGGQAATEPFDFARAVARIGTARGVTEFVRVAYIERNGQSNLAVPLSRIRVSRTPSRRALLCDELDTWLRRLRRVARDDRAPVRLRLVEHRLADALFAVLQHPDEPARWQEVLLSLVAVEELQVAGTGVTAGVVPPLGPEWVAAADDGSPELRLALAFALQGSLLERTGRWDGVRRHWLPLDPKTGRLATAGDAERSRIAARPEVVLRGRVGIQDALALVERRLVEAAQRGLRGLPLGAAARAAAAPRDLADLLRGAVDLERTMALGRALMALDPRRWRESSVRLEAPEGESEPGGSGARRADWPDDGWLAVRLANLPVPLREDRAVTVDPAIVRRLAAGDAVNAVALAAQRLRAAGLHVPLATVIADAQTARRWGAALAFPISARTALAFARRLDPAFDRKE